MENKTDKTDEVLNSDRTDEVSNLDITEEAVEDMKKKINKTVKKKNIGRFFLQMIKSLLLLLVFGAIGVFLAYNSVYGNPDKTVNKVYENFAGANWKVLYNLSEVNESKFVNAVTFVNGMTNKYQTVDLSQISKDSVETEDGITNISISYVYEDNKVAQTLKIIEGDGRVKLFFPEYKLDLNDMVKKNLTIKVPFGYHTTIDGIDVSECERSYSPSTNMMEYYVGDIFEGSHILSCTLEGMNPISEYIIVDEDDEYFEVNAEKVFIDPVIENGSPEIVFGLYENALAGTGIEELKPYFTEDGANQLADIYDKLYADINKEDGAFLKIIEDVSYDISIENSVEGKSVDCVVHFTCRFWAKTPRSNTTGIRKDYDGYAEDSVVIHFERTSDGFKASGMEFECIDYSQR